MMVALTKNAIVAAVDLTKERADVPEWGGYVFISSMTGTDRDAWESEIISIHPYDVPEIIVTPITRGGKDYLNWMASELEA